MLTFQDFSQRFARVPMPAVNEPVQAFLWQHLEPQDVAPTLLRLGTQAMRNISDLENLDGPADWKELGLPLGIQKRLQFALHQSRQSGGGDTGDAAAPIALPAREAPEENSLTWRVRNRHPRLPPPAPAPAAPDPLLHALHSLKPPSMPPPPRLLNGVIANKDAKIRYLHIPRTGGVALSKELQLALSPRPASIDVVVGNTMQAETCFKNWRRESDLNVVMLRSPRDHLLSMYSLCDDGGFCGPPFCPKEARETWVRTFGSAGVTSGKAIQFALSRTNRTITVGLSAWINTFLRANPTQEVRRYGCYDPRNLQMRALSCLASFHVQRGRFASHRFHRDSANGTNEALRMLRPEKADVVGITELYRTTSCIAQFRYKGSMPERCFSMCDHESTLVTDGQQLKGNHSSTNKDDAAAPTAKTSDSAACRKDAFCVDRHGVSRINTHDSGFTPALLQDMDALTREDLRVYGYAVKRVLTDAIGLEKQFAGLKMVCPSDYAQLAPVVLLMPMQVRNEVQELTAKLRSGEMPL